MSYMEMKIQLALFNVLTPYASKVRYFEYQILNLLPVTTLCGKFFLEQIDESLYYKI